MKKLFLVAIIGAAFVVIGVDTTQAAATHINGKPYQQAYEEARKAWLAMFGNKPEKPKADD